jgi:hypothetical protein
MKEKNVSLKNLGINPSPSGFMLTSFLGGKYYLLYYKGEGFKNIIQNSARKVLESSSMGAFLGAKERTARKEQLVAWIKETIENALNQVAISMDI